MALIKKCICGSKNFDEPYRARGLTVRNCLSCAATHQVVEMTQAELRQYYETTYYNKAYRHSVDHDRMVSKSRVAAYRPRHQERLLDIGCGTGTFVDEARQAGANAVGCDLAKVDKVTDRVYEGELIDCLFPTQSFDTITMHDVLEHLVDPAATLVEVTRILDDGGRLLIDLPAFFDEGCDHHWKQTEHLWILPPSAVTGALEKLGYSTAVDKPIPSKYLITATLASRPRRTTMLVPPGIGDIYWTMVKMRSVCASLGVVGEPSVFISSMDKDKDRSVEYVKRVPFVHAAGYLFHKNNEAWRPVWQEAYLQDGKTLFANTEGCDYFLAYNGVMRFGKDIDTIDGPSDWSFPLHQDLEERSYQKRFQAEHGNYIVAYFVGHGMYTKWLKELDASRIGDMLSDVALAGTKVVMVGAKWDVECNAVKHILSRIPSHKKVNMVGATTLPQCLAILRGARAVVGFPSGLTIVATSVGVPTFMFWNKYFHEGFWEYSCPPWARGTTYRWVDTAHGRCTRIARAFVEEHTA